MYFLRPVRDQLSAISCRIVFIIILQLLLIITFQNCNICINTGMSNMLIRPLMLMSLNIIRLLQSSRLGFSAKYTFQWARSIFCNCVTSSSGGYLIMSLDKSGFPSGCKIIVRIRLQRYVCSCLRVRDETHTACMISYLPI